MTSAATVDFTPHDSTSDEPEETAIVRNRDHYKARESISQNLCLQFQDVRYGVTVSALKATITRSKAGHVQILKGITGSVSSGELMAIMGPSGAGKTSLLDVLAYRVKNKGPKGNLSGAVTINSHPLDHQIFSSLCSYVPQIDCLWSALTVRENLLYASRLYRPFAGEGEHKQAVDSTLLDLGLVDCANVKIGNVLIKGVSGGQKRRASIGMELVSGRRVLFLDEPTSGLDAASASTIMKLLKELTVNYKMIVVASIHQPSTHVFYSFDQLLLLSRGRTAYIGPASEAVSFFTEHLPEPPKMMNPADWLLEITNADFTDENNVEALLDSWEDSSRATRVQEMVTISDESQEEKPVSSSANVSFTAVLARMRSLIFRAWLNYLRDPASYLMRLVLIAFMSLFLGAVYSGLGDAQTDILDTTFLIQWGLAFNSYINMVALPAFALERNSVNKEFANGQYRIYQYVVSNAAAQTPFVALMGIFATTGFYWIAGLNSLFSRYVEYCIIMFAQLFYVESVAAFLAATIKDDVLSLAVFGCFISVIFIFNAFFVSVELMPDWLGWIQYLSPFKYAWEALAKIVFEGRTFEPCDPQIPQCFGETGDEVMDFFSTGSQDIAGVNIWSHFAVILALATGARILLGISLFMQHK